MAGRFSLRSSNRHHVRSISLPSRSHPITIRIEEALNELVRNVQSLSVSSTPNVHKICACLSALVDLYKNIQNLLSMPATQEAFTKHREDKWVEELLLDDSLTYLDICSNTRDNILFLKASFCQLQSALRRRRNGGNFDNIESHVSSYFQSSKKLRKDLAKSFAAMKQRDHNRRLSASSLTGDLQQHDDLDVIMVFREANRMLGSIFKSLLFCFSLPTAVSPQPKPSGWSLVLSRLPHKRLMIAASQGQRGDDVIEMEQVDAAVNRLMLHGLGSRDDPAREKVQFAGKSLKELEVSIDKVEDELDSLFRCLIRTRVCLLNVLSP